MADEPESDATPPDDNEERIEIVAVNQPRVRPPVSKAEREERERIVAAIERITKWAGYPANLADLADVAREVLLGAPVDRSFHFAKQFQLPDIRPGQSLEEWKLERDKAFQRFCDDELRKCLIVTSVDAPAAETIKRRGTGKSRPGKVRSNAPSEMRDEWAALRWMRYSWTEIAEAYFACDSERELKRAVNSVTRAANDILRRAGLLD